MADKRISQLTDRGTVANNDVLPIVVSGAVTTNKATISSIQTFMQGNLDLGVTSVGITLGSSGTDVNVTGSPITTSGNITINIPDASTSARGVVTTGAQNFAGNKSFQNTIFANAGVRLDQNGTALPTFVQNISGTGLSTTGANGVGFNNLNNFFFAGSDKGCAVFEVNNTGTRNYTLQNASGTLAFTSDLTGFVTLGTAQTITAQKTFTGSGGSDTMIISHGSGSGFALDVIKAGNGEVIRVLKTSGSGNAMTVQGGNFEAPTIVKTGGTSSQFLMADGSVNTSVLASGAYLPLAGGTLTGALNGTSAVFSGLNLTLNNTSSTGSDPLFTIQSLGAGNPRLKFLGQAGVINRGAVGDSLFFGETADTGQYIFRGTGAATFSSSVTANSFNLGNGKFLRLTRSSGDLQYDALGIVAGTDNTRLISTGDFDIVNGGLTSQFKVSSTGNVGIGTATPTAKLQVIGANELSTFFLAMNNGASGATFARIANSYPFNKFTFQNGYIDVGLSYMAYPISIEAQSGGGQLALTRSGAVAEFFMGGSTGGTTQLFVRSGGSGGVRLDAGSTGWVADSDIRLKDIEKPIENAVQSLSTLQTVYYSWKDSEDKKLNLGLIAQEVEEVFPELVSESSIDEMKGVKYTELIPVLVAAIKELKTEIDSLKNQIK